MIEEIRIRSLGVIAESVLELGPGLCVITGETGAGKTMLVTALGLLLGDRADPGAVRSGSSAARVEGVLLADDRLAAEVEELGGEVEDGRLLVARQLAAEGRSRAFVGGAAVPISTLSNLAESWVAVHGQSDQHRLLRPGAQLAAVDSFAGKQASVVAGQYAAIYARLRHVEAAVREVTGSARERAREADLLRLGLREIESVDPRPGEDVALAAEESRLGFADTLRSAAEQARASLSADSETSSDALGLVAVARRALESVRAHDPGAAELADRVAEISYGLGDVAAEVASYAAGLENDPARLAGVSQRRAELSALTKKYAESIDQVLVWAQAAAQRLVELDTSDERIEELRAEQKALRERLAEQATTWSRLRHQAAKRLSKRVEEELSALAMPQARLVIEVHTSPDVQGLEVAGERIRFGPDGIDEVQIRLAANAGSEPRSLDKGASGGELSRVMLAIEVALAGTSSVPTFVFDEVDAGVGGKAAVEVGRRLAALARSAQVLVVTHLPQVAAFADRHVVVDKQSDGSVTTSGLTVLDDAGRVRELSRMLAGMEHSDTARAHAAELLDAARAGRNET